LTQAKSYALLEPHFQTGRMPGQANPEREGKANEHYHDKAGSASKGACRLFVCQK
jgi:hypothetical protein